MIKIDDIQKDNSAFEDQLMKPSGEEGKVVGEFLADINQEKILWTLSLLDIKPTDTVLEIGYGPGNAIQELSKIIREGKIYGVDFSDVMFEAASKLNTTAINASKVDLTLGSFEDAEYLDSMFDKIIAINMLYFWNDPIRTLNKVRRLLKVGGSFTTFIYSKDSELQKERSQDGVFKHYDEHDVEKIFVSVGLECKTFKKSFEEGKMIGLCTIGTKAESS